MVFRRVGSRDARPTGGRDLEIKFCVHLAAVGASRSLYVRIVSIDVGALPASKDIIVTSRWLKAPTPKFGIEANERQTRQ